MDVAERKQPADLVIRNVGVVNVFTEAVELSDVSIKNGRIARASPAKPNLDIPSAETLDGTSKFLFPGLIDAHTHIEMSLLAPSEYASIVLPQGTTAAMVDMHDVTNVGLECMRHHAADTAATPLKAHLMIPPCVPGTPKLEDAGAEMTLESLRVGLGLPSAFGIGETMDFDRVLQREPEIMIMLSWSKSQDGMKIDGHCPQLMGDALQAYQLTGVFSDHESGSLEELNEKYRLGMKAILRRGSLSEPFRAGDFVNSLADISNVLLCTDGCVFLDELIREGGMIKALRQIISEGVTPIQAIKIATYNVARAYGLDHEIGAIAPGRAADMILCEDLEGINIEAVYLNGEVVTEEMIQNIPKYDYPSEVLNTVKMNDVSAADFNVAVPNGLTEASVRVMNVPDGTVIATEEFHSMGVTTKGLLCIDQDRDLLKIAVFDRYDPEGTHTLGVVRGFGFKDCSFGGTIGQDAQNLVVVGTNDDDMALVVNRLREIQGGVVSVRKSKVAAEVALPISGIMSPKDPMELNQEVVQLNGFLKSCGGTQKNAVFNLSLLLTCAVIPELKMTNQGLVHAVSAEFRPLFTGTS